MTEIDNLRQLLTIFGQQSPPTSPKEEIDCGHFLLRPLQKADAPSIAQNANNIKIANMVQDKISPPLLH